MSFLNVIGEYSRSMRGPRGILFGAHCVFTFLVVLLLSCWIFFWSYPGDLLFLQGGEKLFYIWVIALLAGPFLTFFVFKPQKKTLRFDLAVIFFLQTTVLLGGLSVFFINRPVLMSFVGDRFFLLSSKDLTGNVADLLQRTSSWSGVHIAQLNTQIKDSEAGEDLSKLIPSKDLLILASSVDFLSRFPLDLKRISAGSQDISGFNAKYAKRLSSTISVLGVEPEKVFLFQVVGRVHDGIAILRRSDGRVMQVLSIPSL